ncbi:MAG: choice-of-anchor tandem repeat GloVer-containing protein [Candidatus Cybelea sp.]
MKSFTLSGYALNGGMAVALLAGCGESQTPIGAPGAMPQGPAPARTVVHRTTTSSYLVLHKFDRPRRAAHPLAALIDVDGMLYGTTPHGGRSLDCGKGFNGCGTVYQINEASGAIKVLFTFSGGDGAAPYAGLVDVKGTLYGTTSEGGEYGCGAVYNISTTGTYTPVHSFGCGPSDGKYPAADLIDVNGTLYGTTVEGGECQLSSDEGCGTVYSISRSGSEKVLYNFGSGTTSASSGLYPSAGLIDVNGILYGTTAAGGRSAGCGKDAGGCGTVYSLSTMGKEKVLHSFTGASDGAYPLAGLVDANGILYGTTRGGGHNSKCKNEGGCGTVYSLSTTGKEKVLHSFTGASDGAYPLAGLVDVNGILYGTTSYGGAAEDGTIFSISTAGVKTVLHSFAGGSDGASPEAGLLDLAGALYGTTINGGGSKCHARGCGTVFEITP